MPLTTAPDLAGIDDRWRAPDYGSSGRSASWTTRWWSGLWSRKPRLLGQQGTTPGLNRVRAHLNRLIRQHDVDATFRGGGW